MVLALLSGTLNLSSQSVYLKLISVSQGDLYSTQASVVLIFILGTALGSLLSSRVVRFLPLIELLTGIIPLILWWSFPNWQLPLWATQLAMALVATATGTHLPLYSAYARRVEFSIVYFFYHFGSVFSLLAVEWYFLQAGSISHSLLFLALAQLFFGFIFCLGVRFQSIKLPVSSTPTLKLRSWFGDASASVLLIGSASLLSFYNLFECFREQIIINEPFRMHVTFISAGLLFWMTVAGSVSGYISKLFSKSRISLELLMGLILAVLFIQRNLMSFYAGIERINNGALVNYFFASFLLALCLTLPSFFSSLIFTLEVERDEQKADGSGAMRWSAGRLGFVAAIGIYSATHAPQF